MISAPREGSDVAPTSSSALDNYAADEEPTPQALSNPAPEEVFPQLGELKRPMSRKKVPSASGGLGLGACSSPLKITDAFEQRKMRQPIPNYECWGPRPPSRHRLPPKASLLDVTLDEESKIIATGAARSRSEGAVSSTVGRPGSKAGTDQVVSGTWAAARYSPNMSLTETRRGRKAKDWSAPEDLGIFGSGTRSPNGQQLSKSFSSVFEHHTNEFRERVAEQRQASNHAGSWASHVDNPSDLEVSGLGLGGGNLWLYSPVNSVGTNERRKNRHPESVSVEDVEADQDLGSRVSSFRRDVNPQVIVTRSSQPREKQSTRRGRDERLMRGRQGSMPFGTSLDVDFLSLFAL